MKSPSNSSNNLDKNAKYKSIDAQNLSKLQSNLQQFLKNEKTLTPLKILIQKYESLSLHEIEKYLFTDFRKFKDITHHKIREFVRRRIRNERKTISKGNIVYQSDDSNLVSPFSRDSFSSRSDTNVSPNSLNNIKAEINKLWKYPMCQKEICQILNEKGELDLADNKISINFETLKQSTVVKLNEFINISNKQLDKYLSDEYVKILHDVFLEQHITDEKIGEIYKIIKRREKVSINENGKFLIDVYSLKRDTVSDLIKFLCPQRLLDKSKHPIKTVVRIKSSEIHHNNSTKPTISHAKSSNDNVPSQSRFTTDHLRFLKSKVREFPNDGPQMREIINIIREHEPLKQTNDEVSLNFLKMKDVTLEKMFRVINSHRN